MNNKVMITGINGFIGSHLYAMLRQEGYQVIGISIEEKCLINGDIAYEQADIGDLNKVSALFEHYRPDYVIHLAAIVHKKSMLASYDDFYHINYAASKNIFENCTKHKVKKLIFASTVEVYDMVAHITLNEDSRLSPMSDYGQTKLMAEQSLIELAKDTDLQYAIMRLAPVYGKDFRLNLDRRIYLVKNKVLYYFGKGDYFYNMCSVNNIVDFAQQYLQKNSVAKGIYNISDTNTLNVKQIVELEQKNHPIACVKMPYYLTRLAVVIVEKIFSLIGKKSIISLYNFEKIFKCIRFDNTKATEIIEQFKWDIRNTF